MTKLGKTGDFPHGKSRADDEGALQFAVGVRDRLVTVDFSTPVVWFQMPPDLARAFARALNEGADEAAEKSP